MPYDVMIENQQGMVMENAAPAAATLAPVAANERIQALDVVRGFALIGILLMNVEFFNRAISTLGTGMQAGLTGANFWVSYFVQYFVVGKFWTIFSLLFGMGFAVMLTRAERAERAFLVPYMRRIAALAVFGALHSILLWSGDILFSYAVAAAALLIVLYGRPKWIAAAIVLFIGCGFIPGMKWSFGVAGSLVTFSLAGWWLRGEQRITRLGGIPVIGFVLLLLGVITAIAAVTVWVLPGMPREARIGGPVLGFALLAIGVLTCKYHANRPARPWRLGVGLYCFSFFMVAGTGALFYAFPEKPAAVVTQADAKKADERAAERAKFQKQREERIQTETRVHTTGSYADGVKMRTERWLEHAPGQAGFATILICMFLIGYWFVRSGIMENTRVHLPLFRKLAMFGLPVGIGLGLLGATISMHPVPGSNGADGWQLASGLQMLGNLPASLGYVSLVILMLHSSSVFNKVSILAPFGRMALSNYLMQSLIGAVFFFGYGLGNWGMSRVDQMLYVVVVIIFQIAFSHFWLARFRYGPMEWLWRAVTYWKVPPMRLAARTDRPVAASPA